MPPSTGTRPAHVRPLPLDAIAARLGTSVTAAVGVPLTGPRGTPLAVTGITHDSRAVRPGDLYAALPGFTVHGAQFCAQAAQAGAVAVLTDADGAPLAASAGLPAFVVPDPRQAMGPLAALVYGEPSRGMLLLGVTGTNGKTTVTYLLEAGLRAAGRRTGLIGTIETRIGDERLPSARTTPEATDLQALFALMRERAVDAVAMEVSSHALALGRVAGSRFDVALFTNLSPDHLDFHKTLDDYFAAKASLFTPPLARRGVVNVDDAYGRRLVERAGVPITTVSTEGRPDAEWRATDIDAGHDGSSFTLLGPDGARARGSVRLPGAFNVANAVGAIVMLVTAGVPLAVAAEGVATCPGVPGRLEPVEAGQPFEALVDYAHTPDAVERVLTAVRTITPGRVIVVLGCGGDRDRDKRPLMGAAAARLADIAVLTNDNPRSERPEAILAAMLAGVEGVPPAERGQVTVRLDRAEAIAEAVRQAGPGDTVVVAGKGHEQGQEVQGVMRPFDDRVALRQAIAAAPAGAGGNGGTGAAS